MLEIFGKSYYIDIDAVTSRCETGGVIKNEDGTDSTEINIFQYEVIKMCIERVLNEFEDPMDEEMGFFSNKEVSVSFKMAFNTLIKNNIIIEEDE
jgi:hypothetical protein